KILFLAKKYKCSKTYITTILLKNNIPRRSKDMERRKHIFNFRFFEKINTKEKAYFLGLFYADGHVSNNHAFISLVEKDRHILEEAKLFIKFKESLMFIKRESPRQNMYRLCLGSKDMVIDLCRVGCFHRKTLTLRFPTEKQVPKHLLKFFIRGYFDGDGCICHSRNNLILTIASTNQFCISIQNIFSNILGNKSGSVRKHAVGNVYIYYLGGNNQTLKIFKWLYSGGGPRLNRKFKKYKDFIKQYVYHPSSKIFI
ncbi:MAG: LAGLIDADG family homing endonuclease, partial [Nanoarchaeota archaeon]